MNSSDFDINTEYEKLFGTAQRVNFFDEDEDYYNIFRPKIESAKSLQYPQCLLPFPQIELKSYINSLLLWKLLDDILYNKKRQFRLEVEGVCKAFGYYEPETTYFYICKGSLVSLNITTMLVDEAIISARERFIRLACVEDGFYYRVTIDARCRSASAAATYTLGRRVNGWLAWKDDKGHTLKDCYKK